MEQTKAREKSSEIIKETLKTWKQGDNLNEKLASYNKRYLRNTLRMLISEDLRHFSFEDDDYNLGYLPDAIELLADLIMKYPDKSYKDFILYSLYNLINIIISTCDDEKNKHYQVLLKAKDTLERKRNEYPEEVLERYENECRNIETIIFYVVFELKNYRLFKKILLPKRNRRNNSSPTNEENQQNLPPGRNYNIVNAVNKSGDPLIKVVIQKYLLALKNDNHNDQYYYYLILNRIVRDKDFRISEAEKSRYKTLINNSAEAFAKRADEKEQKRIKYMAKILINGLDGDFSLCNTKEKLDTMWRMEKDFDKNVKNEAAEIITIAPQIISYPYIIIPKERTIIDDGRRRFYTFDDHPQEIDDAISVTRENGLLIAGVHIADPLAYIIPNPDDYLKTLPPLLAEARRRTESKYFSNHDCIPMFPLQISKDLMSLNEGKRVRVMSYYFYFDELTGQMINLDIREEVIKVDKNYEYTDFNQMINGDPEIGPTRDFQNLELVAKMMKDIYVAEAIDFIEAKKIKRPEILDNLEETGASASTGINVVTSFMIHTNSTIAKKADDVGIPLLFRGCGIDGGRDRAKQIKNKVEARNPMRKTTSMLKVIDNYSHAYYSLDYPEHDRLWRWAYVRITSTLRRYADIVSTMPIKRFMCNREFNQSDIIKYRDFIAREVEVINNNSRSLEMYLKECGLLTREPNMQEYEKRLELNLKD